MRSGLGAVRVASESKALALEALFVQVVRECSKLCFRRVHVSYLLYILVAINSSRDRQDECTTFIRLYRYADNI